MLNCLKAAQVDISTELKLVSDEQVENEIPVNDSIDEQNENITDMIDEGIIFAVLCEDDTHDFYLLKATSGVQTLKRKETDRWGASFPATTSVITGLYLTQEKNSILQYKPNVSVLYICQDFTINNNSLTLAENENSTILECVNLSEIR